jgi:hypothetical protein
MKYYDRLKEEMHSYCIGKITRLEMKLAIGPWQIKEFGRVA